MNPLFPLPQPATPNDHQQSRLLTLAAIFLFLYSIILTISPAVKAHTLSVPYRWTHWIGFAVWLVAWIGLHRLTVRRLPDRDPYLLPIAGLLTGWGLLTIWRLSDVFGSRQTIWLALGAAVLAGGLLLKDPLAWLRRYKYLWLTGGLLLTGLTFLFGTYPGGIGPHLWLGCCGLYLQPSEPLKLLLIAYLAAYLADHIPMAFSAAQLYAPTVLMTVIALVLLFAQRDLGTALLFLLLYAAIVFIASGSRRALAAGLIAGLVPGVAGYLLFDVVRVRVDAWINPWLDPSGRSYQIVQSLITVSAGGLIGRGPGLGDPSLVPVAHSDFIFAAIAEETGLLGCIAFLILLALLAVRGFQLALRAQDGYRRYLTAGLTIYLVGQSLLIVGGNLRLFPLTGVTLPFVSYGGSSLLTSFFALLFLLLASHQSEREPAQLPNPRPYLLLGGVLLIGIAAAALIDGWWSLVRSAALLNRNDNQRRYVSDRYVRRGSLLDRSDAPLDVTIAEPGSYTRFNNYPPLSPVLGYTHPVFGQAGLEASLDPFLRGLQGYPSSLIWWNHLLYGQPPPGLDVRLSLSLDLQRLADQLLGDYSGAIVLLNARSGEILVMASHPYFDSNQLEREWDQLQNDPRAPMINRATQGVYPAGQALGPFLYAQALSTDSLPSLPGDLAYALSGNLLDCAFQVSTPSWAKAVASGCPAASVALGKDFPASQLLELFDRLGFYTAPAVPLPAHVSEKPAVLVDRTMASLGLEGADVNPLQMALAAAALTNAGERPAPRLALSVHTLQGWVVLPAGSSSQSIFDPAAAQQAVTSLATASQPSWQTVGRAQAGQNRTITWFLGGTLPNWSGPPLALAVVLEQDAPQAAAEIGQGLLKAAQKQ